MENSCTVKIIGISINLNNPDVIYLQLDKEDFLRLMVLKPSGIKSTDTNSFRVDDYCCILVTFPHTLIHKISKNMKILISSEGYYIFEPDIMKSECFHLFRCASDLKILFCEKCGIKSDL